MEETSCNCRACVWSSVPVPCRFPGSLCQVEVPENAVCETLFAVVKHRGLINKAPNLPLSCVGLPSILMTHAWMIHASKPQTIRKRHREMYVILHPWPSFTLSRCIPALPYHQSTGFCSFPRLLFSFIFSFLGALSEGQEKPANRSLTFPFCPFELNPPAMDL